VVITFAGGTGTQADPWLISTPEQLQAMSACEGAAGVGKYFRLTNDIDLSSYLSADGAGYNGGEGWVPIGSSITNYFTGNFEGGGHVIKNLTINRPTTDFQGPFGYITVSGTSGSIANLGLVDAKITAQQYIGALAGQNHGAAITSSYSLESAPDEAFVTGTTNVGGLVGVNQGVLTNCFATGDVSGIQFVGGLVGNCQNSPTLETVLLVKCFASGDVAGTGMFNGGLAGNSDVSITECHASGAVAGNEETGGLVG